MKALAGYKTGSKLDRNLLIGVLPSPGRNEKGSWPYEYRIRHGNHKKRSNLQDSMKNSIFDESRINDISVS